MMSHLLSKCVAKNRFCLKRLHCNAMRGSAFPVPEFDWNYVCNVDNVNAIKGNIRARKGVGNIDRVIGLWNILKNMNQQDETFLKLRQQLLDATADIPNKTHPNTPLGDESCARQIKLCGKPTAYPFKPKSAVDIAERMGSLLMQNTGYSSGPRSYYLLNDLALLEQSLIHFTLDTLRTKYNFKLVSVPNTVKSPIIERCGFKTKGNRTQVYGVKTENLQELSLAGTGEFPLAGFFMKQTLQEEDLPLRVATVSHCYRAEVSDLAKESGIFRVHQFTKVEMFAVTEGQNASGGSDEVYRDFVRIQQYLFESLGLHIRVLDMPSEELGAPAYCKVDIEAWLPTRQFWGEISSASNCTDFQSRRLGIKYNCKDGHIWHCHTVNGTACAVPRMLIAILESYQQHDGSVQVPEALVKYMHKRVVFNHG